MLAELFSMSEVGMQLVSILEFDCSGIGSQALHMSHHNCSEFSHGAFGVWPQSLSCEMFFSHNPFQD